ncbi:DUF6193 family natural product biosynthesis protein [Actinoplanes subglobosus]|uniref:DUF6193 family natural product biosynthesis protein n=1 Tax=Actinoplanes subglobosus TaxID=1547892 RepID=A0ABV8IZH7_9ACTN
MQRHSHHPDATAAGDVRVALQNAFDTLGVPLEALHSSSPGWARTHARAVAGDREAQVHMSPGARAFSIGFWTSGFNLAAGSTPDLAQAAAAISMFLNGAGLRQIHEAWPFMTYSDFAEALERSEADAIDFWWRRFLTRPRPPDRRGDLHDFLVEAEAEPRLRALFPFTSHADLGLRRLVRSTPNTALAWVRPLGDGRYLIAGPDRRQLYTPGPTPKNIWGEDPEPGALGPAAARESVALTLAVMDNSTQH